MSSNASQHAALVALVAHQRDREAFGQLFDHFAPRIQAYMMRQGSDRAAAEDLTQDVMTTLWRKAELFDPEKSSLATWLYRIAIFILICLFITFFHFKNRRKSLNFTIAKNRDFFQMFFIK